MLWAIGLIPGPCTKGCCVAEAAWLMYRYEASAVIAMSMILSQSQWKKLVRQIHWVCARHEDLAEYLNAPYCNFQSVCWKICGLLCSSVTPWCEVSWKLPLLSLCLPPRQVFPPYSADVSDSSTAMPVPPDHHHAICMEEASLSAPSLPNPCFACFLNPVTFIFEWILPPHPSLLHGQRNVSLSLCLCVTICERWPKKGYRISVV